MTRRTAWLVAHRVDLALFALVLCIAVPIVQPLRAQQASRLALTAAIWDDASIRIDDYPLGVDRAERDGHTYSDKAPGQPVLALPAYAAYRALGGEPAVVARVDGNLGLWAVSVWSSAIPAAILAVLMHRAAQRVAPSVAVLVALSLAVGTLLLPFSTLLFGHVLAATLAFGGWVLATGTSVSRPKLALAGLLLATSVATEYSIAGAAIAVTAYVAYRRRAQTGWFLAGAAPAAAALLLYQRAAFGSPWQISYSRSSFQEQAESAGIERLDPPLLERAIDALVGGRGLLTLSPVLVLAAIGLVRLCRREAGHDRWGYAAAAAAAATVIAVQMSWSNPTGGDSPGARYATASAAFLAPGLACAWERWRRAAPLLAAIGIGTMVAATVTDPLIARDASGVVQHWFEELVEGSWSPSVLSMLAGDDAGRALQVLLVAAGVVLVVSQRRAALASGP